MRYTDFVALNVSQLLEQLPNPFFVKSLSPINKRWAEYLAKEPLRKGFNPQVVKGVMPIVNLLQNKSRAAILNGEMGVGKTTMANLIVGVLNEDDHKEKGMKVIFLASGSKHEQKMVREANETLGDIVETFIIRPKPRRRRGEITIEECLDMSNIPGKILYFILSKDSGKNTFKDVASTDVDFCQKCGEGLTDKVRSLKTADKIRLRLGIPGHKIKKAGKSIYQCSTCSAKTWSTVSGSPSIGDIIAATMKSKSDKKFDLAIIDEVHEMQNPNSLQSIMYKQIVQASYRALVMTGTLSNGYASSIFHILYPLLATHFKKYGGFDYDKIGAFIDFFGFKKTVSKVRIDSIGSKRRSQTVQELPQINDRIVGFLAPYTVWFTVEDLGIEMPPFKEISALVEVDPEVSKQFEDWKNKVLPYKNFFNDARLHHFNMASHYRINNPTMDYTYEVEEFLGQDKLPEDHSGAVGTATMEFDHELDKYRLHVRVDFEPLPMDFESNKEKKLVSIVEQELSEGRRTIIYGLHDKSINLYERLIHVLNRHGIEAEAMPSNLKSEDIEQWFIQNESDVVIVPQKRVATGLDLIMYHTIVFYEMDDQLRVVQQAKVRPWRPVGQDKEVRCYYVAYRGSQERSLVSMAQKMRAAATIEGKILDPTSIAAQYDYNPEMTAAVKEIAAKVEESGIKFVYDKDVEDENSVNSACALEDYYAEQVKLAKAESKDDTETNDTEATDNPVDSFEIVADTEDIVSEVVIAAKEELDAVVAEVKPEPVQAKPKAIKREVMPNIAISEVKTTVEKNGQMAFVF